MSMWTALEPPATTVAPGESTAVRLRVRNTGDTVEEYRLSPVGDAAGWASVEPTVLRLYPGAEGTAEVTFAPPRTPDALAGPTPFGIRVEPREHPGEADVVEGRLTISPFAEFRAELVPRTVKGRRRARGRVAVDNLGNQPLTASFSTRDNGDAVTVEANPTAVQVDPGRAGFAEVQLTAVNVSWVGGIRQHPFTISVLRSGEPAPQELRGTYVQPSVFPRWVLAVGSVLVAAIVAFAVVWFQHDMGVKSQASEKAPAKEEPLPQGSNTPLPSAPPPPSKQPPPPSQPAPPAPDPGGQPKPKDPGGGGSGGGGGNPAPKQPKYDPNKLVRIQSGLGYLLVTATDQKAEGRYVYTAPTSFNSPPWDQFWHVRPLPNNEFAFTSSSEPWAVADNTREGNQIQMWGASGGEASLSNGSMTANQKWSIQPINGADGFVRLVSRDDNWCLSDLTPNDRKNLQVAEVRPCGALPDDQQRWKILQ
ncbi:hydrogenase expression protein [Streptomyces sp. NPDC001691]|uniref:hydrogenase expression protein n=1 Tax=unclassified Streptomyces TaxID=2593676 RepID=UPI0011C079C8|nr:hydrogenase expression protein [Streptomyces sp. SDr-06]